MSFIDQPSQLNDKQRADKSGLRLIATLKQECINQFNIAWKKGVMGKLVLKTQAECQAFFDAYGVKSVLAFTLHGKLQELIYMTDSSWVPLVPPYEYVVNQDNTVTIGALKV